MNTRKTLFGVLALLLLTGCSDASAVLSDRSTAILSVGDTTITKGDVYDRLLPAYSAPAALQHFTEVVCDKEVEVTPEMEKTAQDNLDYYKTVLGDYFEEYMASMGLDEESFLKEQIMYQQNELLPSVYVNENYTVLAEQYKPIKGTILTFESYDNANSALSALKDGSMNAQEAAHTYGSTSTGEPELITMEAGSYDPEAVAVLRSAEPDDGWTVIKSTSGTSYVLKVEEKDYEALKEEASAVFEGITQVQQDTMTWLSEKYGFKVYDIDLIRSIYADYPYLLTQKIPSSLTD